jgi:ParB family chromosome partitioning protein
MAFQGDSIYWVEVEKIVPNPFQPRREFDQHKLQELADSIRMYGVLQPLTVTRKEIQREDGTFYSEYELIAGERRLRASKLAGIAQVPVIIREGEQSEQEKLELAIIENLQREDLNAVDRAIAFRQLADQFGLSHTQVAQKVGRSREYVSNSIRLLALPGHMLDSLKRNDMMEGHARTLLMLSDRPEEQEVVYKEILLKKLSVREVERIVRKIATDKIRKKVPGEFDANLIEFEKKFTETLGTRVQILKTDFGGKLTIDYFSVDDLESILRRIKDETAAQVPTQQEMTDRLVAATPLAMAEVPIMPPIPTEPITHYAEPEEWLDTETVSAGVNFVSSEPVVSLVQSTPFTPVTASEPIEQIAPEVPVEIPNVTDHGEPVAPTPIITQEEDESSLYSIRNFSV